LQTADSCHPWFLLRFIRGILQGSPAGCDSKFRQ
jgi:hypothetical protein